MSLWVSGSELAGLSGVENRPVVLPLGVEHGREIQVPLEVIIVYGHHLAERGQCRFPFSHPPQHGSYVILGVDVTRIEVESSPIVMNSRANFPAS